MSSTLANVVSSSLSSLASSTSSSAPSSPADPNKTASKPDEQPSFTFIVSVASATFFALMLIIFAVCKYRNRDEGTYRIDETKNFGPFAELDAPLNGGNGKKSTKASSASSKNRRKGVGVKEWYV